VRVVLWDIDGTLVRAGDIGGTVFAAAVESVFGVPALDHGVRYGGKTDPQIAREILVALSIDHDESHLAAVLAELERALAAGQAEMREAGVVLPGAAAVLAALHEAPDVVNTVLTGNTRANAVLKLETFGLDRWIDVDSGAYGSDHADRNALVPIALGRVEGRHGAVDLDRVWVVGDTPFDAACARAGGARCLLVATGHADRTALDEAGAERVIDDLADTEAVLELLSRPRPARVSRSWPAGG
jgi:phosphoglycolate phosphatase